MKSHSFTRRRPTAKACVMLLAVAMLTAAPLASAQTIGASHDVEDWSTALGFVSCAAAIVLASSTAQVWLAALTCGKVIVSEIGI